MRLEHCTWPQVEAYQQRCRGIILPIGSTEQHGPAGLIGTDHLCAQAVARRAGALANILVAPTLAIGMSQFHLGFPGSLSLRPSTLTAVVHDVLLSLAATGFTHVYVLNGHGGNLAPMRAAIQEIFAARSFGGAAGPALNVRVRSWWELPRVNALRQDLYGADEGFHATPSEVAITMASEPEAISAFTLAAPPPLDDLLDHAGDNYADAADFRRRFPDGRVGSHSALATRAHGEKLLALAEADLAADFATFLQS